MKIKYSPQVSNRNVEYSFDNEVIKVTIDNKSDVFDFSSFSDGRLDSVETCLPVNPIIQAHRKGGVLYVELINFISKDASEDEKYPDWIDVNG